MEEKIKIIDIDNMVNVPVIDLSKIKSGKQFGDIIFNSNSPFHILVGERDNPVLSKIYEDELTPKFNIGDTVRFNKEQLEFDGIDDNNTTWTVVGLKKVDNQFLYSVRNDYEEYDFFGYELEKI